MPKSRFVQQIEEERKFLRLYHEEEITALNISRLLDFDRAISIVPNSPYNTATTMSGAPQYQSSKELKDVFQLLRKSSFLQHFAYHSDQRSVQIQQIEQAHWSHGGIFGSHHSDIVQTIASRLALSFQHQTLIQGLTQNKYLTHIDLGKMFMGDQLAQEFSKILLINKVISWLNLSHNAIPVTGGLAIAGALANYTSLAHLDFSNNQITLPVMQKLAETLATNGNLIYLNLQQPYFPAGGDDAIMAIVDSNKDLSHLDIANIPLTTKEILVEAKASEQASPSEASAAAAPEKKTINAVLSTLEDSAAMEYLNIAQCFAASGATGAIVIAALFAQNTNITEINIASNALQAVGLSKIATALGHNTKLKVLDISNNGLGEGGGDIMATILLENHSITKLNASNNGLGYGGVKPIANALKSNTSLLEMTLSSNNLDEAGGLFIGKALEQNHTLTTLDLSTNAIQAVGAMYIAQALLNNHHLKHLNLANNQIVSANQQTGLPDYRGIEALSTVMNALVTLNLSNNNINSDGAQLLAVGLNGNNSLVGLYLKDNPLTHIGVRAVVEAIAKHNHILRLDLSNTQMTDHGALQLFNALQHNLSIADLDISMNSLTNAGAVHIVSLLQHNVAITKLKINQIVDPVIQLRPDAASMTIYSQLLNLENAILAGVKESSLIELSGISDLLSGKKLLFEVSKHNDVLQSNLRKLETAEGQNFDMKLLFVLLKQLQGHTSDSIPAEISYADMKSDEFYIRKIAEIFNTKHYQPAQRVNIVEIDDDAVVAPIPQVAVEFEGVAAMPVTAAAAVVEEIAAVPPGDIYFDALVDGGLLGYLDVPADVM